MPVNHASMDGKPGYRWGNTGNVYTYTPGDPISQSNARQKAFKQGQAIEMNKHSSIAKELWTTTATQAETAPSFDIQKFYDDEQLVFGWASVAKNKDGDRPIEWQGDEIEAPEMEPAIYDFVLSQGITKEMHRAEKARGQIVESVIFTKEKMAAMGIPEGTVPEGWWVGFKLSDRESFMKVKAGIYKMFSIEGQGKREPIGGTK